MKSKFSATPIQIAVGRHRGNVSNDVITWGALIERLARPTATGETFDAYNKMSKDEQGKLKNVDGYWIGAHCKDGKRLAKNIEKRQVAAFDIDAIDHELLDELRLGTTEVSQYEWFAHSSRSHTPEEPRLRIVFLIDGDVPAEEYEALVRILAWKLDPSMETVDPVSFRVAQIMYMPTVSADMKDKFFYFHNPGEPVVPEEIFEEWQGDHTDRSQLPKRADEDELREKAAKAEDPTAKSGIVGAFCRTFDIESAISEFIPDVYEPADQMGGQIRYNYKAGHGASGAVIYDDGRFIYSHHSSDPCGERLVNAWDMVRIHRFGHLDKSQDEGKTASKMPSFKEMADLAKTYKVVRRELMQERGDPNAWFTETVMQLPEDRVVEDAAPVDTSSDDEAAIAALVGEAAVTPSPTKDWDENWVDQLDTTPEGFIKQTLPNISVILLNDLRFRGCFAYNEFTQMDSLVRTLNPRIEYLPTFTVQDKVNGDPCQDVMDHTIRAVLESPAFKYGFDLRVPDRDLRAAIELSSRAVSFHPVRRKMRAVVWDGKSRIDRLFIDYVGADDTEYHRQAARMMMIAAVARIHEPGHKFDYVPVLEGAQGIGKSTFWRFLAFDQYFTELHGDITNRQKMVETMSGNFIVEFGELATLYRREADEAKDFISGTKDQVRLAYRRNPAVFKRQNIFVASTNKKEYLKDPTGNRRYWPIRCDITQARFVTTLDKMVSEGIKVDQEKLEPGTDTQAPMIDTERLRAEVPQLWAEAVAAYDEMRRERPQSKGDLFLTLNGKAAADAKIKQDERQEMTQEDVLAEEIGRKLNEPMTISNFSPDHVDSRFSSTGPEPLGIWQIVNYSQIWEDILGRKDSLEGRNVKLLSGALDLLDGWSYVGRVRHDNWHGRYRTWVRDGVSFSKSTPVFKLVDEPEDDEDLPL